MKKFQRSVLITLGALIVTAAAQPPSRHAFAIDSQHSKMTVYVYKQGLFAFAADNHVVNAPIVAGSFDDGSNSVQITVDAAKMQVLDPGMPPDRRAKVQDNMAGPQVLDVAKYQKIEFHSTAIKATDGGKLSVSGALTLHGETHSVTFDVTRKDATHFSGTTMLRQSEFGITPIRIAGGMVRVKDDVKVEFELALKPR